MRRLSITQNCAIALVLPESIPIVSTTVAGFLRPLKFTPVPSALNVKMLLPSGTICAFNFSSIGYISAKMSRPSVQIACRPVVAGLNQRQTATFLGIKPSRLEWAGKGGIIKRDKEGFYPRGTVTAQ